MSVLAIDVGTTMIKAVVFDEQGNELAVSRLATEVRRRHPGWAEQDMDTVWNTVVYTVRNALADMEDPVWLVCFTAQGDGAWLIDSSGRPTGPAILWSDGRAGDILSRWEQEGILEASFRRNGSLTCSGMPNALFSWLGSHDPQRLARSSASLTAAGWLFLRLTGQVAMDASDASAPFLDHASGDYDPEIVDMFGLTEYSRLLPTVLGEEQRIAEITGEAAGQLGLAAGLPVVMAPYDIASTARGVGVVNPGQACSILGTTLCTEIVRKDVDTAGVPSGINIAYRGRERILRAFPTLNGGEVLSWVAKLLHLEGPPELARLAFSKPPDSKGPVFLPYLSPAGERAPFLDPRARGTIWGLSLEHTRADIGRSVFEGLSLILRDSLEASRAAVTELRLCGGGANSDAWCQLIADATGVPTARTGDSELGAKGAFLTGLVLSGAESSMHSAAAKYVRLRSVWEPDTQRSAHYSRQYAAFLRWRDMARDAGWSAAPGAAPIPGPSPIPGPRTQHPNATSSERGELHA